MRSVVIDNPGAVRIDVTPDPVLPDSAGAIVAIESSAICGSDLHFFDGDYPLVSPLALGHEAVGTVVEVGADVANHRVGDRVLVSSVSGCGQCAGCATLDPTRCVRGLVIFGGGLLGGAQSELLAVPAADFHLLAVPDAVDTDTALLLTDNLVTGWAGVARADVPEGGSVIVFGLGAVGLCAVRSALAQGVGTVFAVDPVRGRRARAAADRVITLDPADLGAVTEATGGVGPDSVVDAVASDATLNAGLTCVRAGGTVSVIGVHDLNPYPFPATMCLVRSVTLRSTTAPVQQLWPTIVDEMQSGRLDTSGIVTHHLPFDEAPRAYELAAARSADCVKVALELS
ncbi:alcohol dehydrogenase catalytic domain-containing protein [Gordonia sp. NPDC003585]|uniref:alcohol dehydrogenase catalytic domain-containing protein n=1 Tax=Gordonia sp. NPDC003585 TaxID=3154275 RepID=UPI0033BDC6C4